MTNDTSGQVTYEHPLPWHGVLRHILQIIKVSMQAGSAMSHTWTAWTVAVTVSLTPLKSSTKPLKPCTSHMPELFILQTAQTTVFDHASEPSCITHRGI